MKKVALFSVLLLLYSCVDMVEKPVKPIPSIEGPYLKTIKVEDSGANKLTLGYATRVGSTGLTILSANGDYLYNLGWDGKLLPGKVYYTNRGGQGKPFISRASSTSSPDYEKTIIAANKKLYTYKDGKDGYAELASSAIATYDSTALGDKVSSERGSAKNSGYELKEISYGDAGIPTAITLPLVVTYE